MTKTVSNRVGSSAYVAVGLSYDAYVITEHLGGQFYRIELESDSTEVQTARITGKLVYDSVEPVEPYLATIIEGDGLGREGLYHAGGSVHVWVQVVAVAGKHALIRGDVLKSGELVVPLKLVPYSILA